MHTTYPENIQEHSLRVSMIAHSLAVIRNRMFNGSVSPERTATLALYHDASEVLTGDLPTPVKYFNREILDAYKQIEKVSRKKLLQMIPSELKNDYESLLTQVDTDSEEWRLVEAADKLCAYIKCLEEVSAGNHEFAQAFKALAEKIKQLKLPEVDYFMERFVPSFRLTLDELD